MPYDIGPRIGIDGESEFRRSIQNINANIKSLGSEMKVVTESFADNANSMEALAAKTDVLERSYDQQAKHLEKVQDMLDRAKSKYGENATETLKWQRAVNESTAALKKTENELKDTKEAMDRLEKSTDGAEDAFEDLGKAAEKSGKNFDKFQVAAGNLISGAVQNVAGALMDVASEIYNIDEATEEYRASQGKLQSAFEASGYSVETAKGAYKELYKIMGDTDSATEASQLMAQLSESEADFAEWTKIAAGVAAAFGDSLPVENMYEFLVETSKTGKITGDLTRMLQKAGIAEEDFQKQLDECSTESERNRLIMSTLSGAYDEASAAFYRNNEELIKSRENQAAMDELMGQLGETVARVKNEFAEKFGPTILEIGDNIADFIEGVDTEKLFEKFDDAFTMIKDVWDFADDYFEGIADVVEGSFDAVAGLWKGDFEQARSGVLQVMEGLRKSVQEIVDDIMSSTDNAILQQAIGFNGATGSQMAAAGYTGTYTTGYGKTTTYDNTYNEAELRAMEQEYAQGVVVLDGKKVGTYIANGQSSAEAARGSAAFGMNLYK